MLGAGAGSNSRSSDPVMDDIADLRALLARGELTDGVLEGKYLNQLRRVRQLTVQLESERTRSRQMAAQLEAFQADRRKHGEHNTDDGGKQPRQRRRTPERTTDSENDKGQQNATALRERLDRVFVQLNDVKVQLEEQKKESQRLRKIVQQEVGGSPQDMEVLLKGAADGTGGWRGRAQQIVLLKSKVKELERAMMASGGAPSAIGDITASGVSSTGRGGNGSVATDTVTTTTTVRDMDDAARERVVELQSRRLLQQRELQEELARQKTELDAMKRRLAASQSRHANLESDNRQLREHLQAVLQKTENDNDLIDAYREEIEKLQQVRIELHQAKTELREWEEWCSAAQQKNPREWETLAQRNANGKSRPHGTHYRRDGDDTAIGIDVNTAVALAGADTAIELNRLRLENLQLKSLLSRYGASGAEGDGGEESPTGRKQEQQDDMALLIHWLKSFISPQSAEEGVDDKADSCAAKGASTVVVVDWQGRVAEVLRRSHNAVTFLERQQQEQGERLSKCYEIIQKLQDESKQRKGKLGGKQKEKHEAGGAEVERGGDDSLDIVNIIVQENVALKKRVKVMHELLNKERAAYESLRAASLAPSEHNDGATAEAYLKLRHEYEELRVAFNSLQVELFRDNAA